MLYQSTRSNSPTVSPAEAVLRGIAPDGGLYIFPADTAFDFNWRKCMDMTPYETATAILDTLLPGFENMEELVKQAYTGKFSSPELTPLTKVGEDYVLELYHGPTSAFKDVALSMLPVLITAAHRQLGSTDETVILTATSGDTGKAALAGFKDVPGTRILVFFPNEGVSAIQQAQMVTQEGKNVGVCAVRGNFDDCQTGVKNAFAHIDAGQMLSGTGVQLSSANSINIGRLAPQVVYYFLAYRSLVRSGRITIGETVDFTVPTGNFGDILAGYFAKLLGLPVGKLICASNSNDVLTDFLHTGIYDKRRPFYKTTSPSMDILVSSNLERLLYLVSKGDTALVSDYMSRLSRDGHYEVSNEIKERLDSEFSCGFCTDHTASDTIRQVWDEHHYLIDPHTAVGYHVAKDYKEKVKSKAPMVVLSTASPYKFADTVLKALGSQSGATEFEAMDELSAMTGTAIPVNLASLREKEVLHRDVIDRTDILHYVVDEFIRKEK